MSKYRPRIPDHEMMEQWFLALRTGSAEINCGTPGLASRYKGKLYRVREAYRHLWLKATFAPTDFPFDSLYISWPDRGMTLRIAPDPLWSVPTMDGSGKLHPSRRAAIDIAQAYALYRELIQNVYLPQGVLLRHDPVAQIVEDALKPKITPTEAPAPDAEDFDL